MARKRRIVVPRKEEGPPPPPEEDDRPWREWLREEYARYWFAIAAMFVDAMVVLTIADVYGGVSFPLFALVALLAAEVTLYLRIWGRSPWID